MHPFVILLIGVVVVVGSILVLRLHAFLALVLGALVVAALTPRASLERYAQDELKAGKIAAKAAKDLPSAPWGKRLATAFGGTCAGIGIIIAMAAIIGQCMLESGGADRIVRSTLGLLGDRAAPVGFAAAGFLLGIPVFFDTVFYLMIPLGKAMAARTGKDYGLYVMTIAAGATISHSLVPPTPGPLLVASSIQVNGQPIIGEMILAGIVVGVLSVIPGLLYAFWANRRWPVPLRETADAPIAQLRAMAERDVRTLPPLSLSLLVILLPVVLIVGDALLKSWAGLRESVPPLVVASFRHLGNSNVALGIAAGMAILMWLRYRPEAKEKGATLEAALGSAGQIILITAAGGAFGAMLQQTMVGDEIKAMFPATALGTVALVGAFLVTALVRVAQGSATVAMVTAIGMFAGMADPEKLGFHPVYLALAIGFGSKPLPWMNDSGFWVVCKMSGQTVGETLRNHTVVFTTMGVAGLLLTIAAAKLLPFAGGP